ncbi:MAG: hypothetical protein SF066_11995 [Thermoanaerobaculia bacterium]|nr:hypothetical protein [Thermoanaerobaculia bacterium]
MKLVYFGFRPQTSDSVKEQTYRQVGCWSGVEAVGSFDADAPEEAVRRTAVLRLAPDTDAAAISRRLEDLPSVEYASEPGDRFLVR